MRKLIVRAALVGLAAVLFDRERRRRLIKTLNGLAHRGRRRAERFARGRAADAYALKARATHLREQPKPQPNDATLTAKVESEVLGHVGVPSGAVNVNAEGGIVVLRGQVESPELIAELEAKVRKVRGVRDVENLLHLPGAEAPMHQAHAES
jgi:osmotically-inducible protein OsmY